MYFPNAADGEMFNYLGGREILQEQIEHMLQSNTRYERHDTTALALTLGSDGILQGRGLAGFPGVSLMVQPS